MRIFIYDDNKIELENLTLKIIEIVKKEKVNIDKSSSFIEDKLRINHVFYDIAIIVFNNRETLFLLQVLRHRNKDCKIIVIGNDYKDSRFAYDIKAHQFLLKDELHLLNQEVKRVIRLYKEEHLIMSLYTKEGIKNIFIKDIIYIESNHKMIMICCILGRYEGKVKDLEKLKQVLLNMNFIQIHQSYYVYLESILSIRRGEVMLKNKETLPVSLNYRNQLKEKMNCFYQLG